MSACTARGGMGNHRLGQPDWAGRRSCPCGAVQSFPPDTAGLPPIDPLVAFLGRLYATPVTTLEEFAAQLGVPLPAEAS